jgi:energy-coupling factor transporter ATPase
MISIRDLGYAYEPGRPVLEQVDLDLRRGEWVSILGTNGSGKSTLLKCIIGLLQPTTGTITFESRPDTGPSTNPVGMVFQNPDDQIVSPVVESEIAFGLENLGVPHDEMVARVDAILDQFDLTQHRRRDPHLLSGGERQRLAIASLVIMRPNFLLFDEPASMLDPAVRDQLFDWIRDLRDEGVTPVVVCQNPDEALDSDRLLVCSQGRIVADAPPAELLSHPKTIERYGLSTTTAGRLAYALGWPEPVPITERSLLEKAENIQPFAQPLRMPKEVGAPIVEATDLRFAYNAGLPTQKVALDSISLTICAGEFISLIGPSGSGKSTLALHLNGLNAPTSGTLKVAGLDVANPKTHDELRQQVGLVFQFPESQLFAETVAEDVGYGPRNLALDDIRNRVDRALETVGLDPLEYRDRNPFALSGGERRRVALAGVLATSPAILVLDEPTAGLDPAGADELDRIIRGLHQSGVTVILVTHDLARTASMSDRVIGLLEGRIALEGTPREVFSNDAGLSDLGLHIPPSIRILRKLRDTGHTIPGSILTSDDLADLAGRAPQ